MSKAIAGAAMLVGAGVLFFVPGLNVLMTPLLMNLMVGLAAGGLAMEAGAIADALTSNRGQNITTRQAAGQRQVIYGVQRVGGTVVYQSTTGAGGSGGNYVYNYIIALASHEIDGIINLYLDGRQVYWNQLGLTTANVGCGSVATPPTATATISGGAVIGITATGGAGFGNIGATRYRVRIYGGGGSGATAYATNTGTRGYGIDFVVGTWTVVVTNGGSGYTTAPNVEIQGAYTFGGTAAADQQDPGLPGYGLGYGIGPNGQHYNFAGKVFCEARFGDQPAGDYMASLTANDSNWPSTARGAGVAHLYLNVGYDATNFPSAPEIRVTVSGKNDIYDPRTGLTGYSINWALQVADLIGNMGNGIEPPLGLGDGPITAWPAAALDQLIAAANVCDEDISTSQGATPQWTQHIHYDLSTSPGDALSIMMPSAAGRLSRIGGGWFIWPAYWQGPSFNFDESALIGPVKWTPYRSFKDLINCVNGTYIAPNYPYSTRNTGGIPGQLYDQNGWYYGTIDNLWPFAFQPTNFPQYAQDVLHGYAANEWLTEDGGVVLPRELALRGVLDIVQAQRAAKVVLMRNRYQGSGSFPMSLAAWQMQPTDVFGLTMPALGWAGKELEVDRVAFTCEEVKKEEGGEGEEEGKVMALSTLISVIETGIDVYEWSLEEELTAYDVAAAPVQIPYAPAAPGSVTVLCSAATALVGADGNVIAQARVEWSAPADISVVQIELQYQLVGASVWQEANPGIVSVALFQAFVGPLVAGQTYNFRIRSLRASGTYSSWVQVSSVLASITLSIVVTSGVAIAQGALAAYSLGTTAEIEVSPFSATFGNVTVSCLGAGPYFITGLALNEFYWVYYIDPNFLGGAITPIATQNESDFLNKLGYILIGSIVTPSSGSPVYKPTGYQASGTAAPVNPTAAYDGNPTTAAAILGRATGSYGTPANTAYNTRVEYYLFPSITLSAAATLTVLAATNDSAGGTCNCALSASLNGGTSFSTLLSTTTTTAQTAYTLSVPSGQALSQVQIVAASNGSTGATAGVLALEVFDINIQ